MTLQQEIDSLLRRSAARKGKPGYLAILERLKDARLRQLKQEVRGG